MESELMGPGSQQFLDVVSLFKVLILTVLVLYLFYIPNTIFKH